MPVLVLQHRETSRHSPPVCWRGWHEERVTLLRTAAVGLPVTVRAQRPSLVGTGVRSGFGRAP